MGDQAKPLPKRRRVRDQDQRTADGKYDKGPVCRCCTGPAGEDYFSHQLTDSVGSDGVEWGDIALVLCDRCATATMSITTVAAFEAHRKKVRQKHKQRSKQSIEELALQKLSEAFDRFVGACLDTSGQPKAPSVKDLAKARGYLPPYCTHAYPKRS